MTKQQDDAAKAAAEQAKADEGEGETPRPTGKNAEQDAEIAALTATSEALVEQMAAMQEQMTALLAAVATGGAAPTAVATVAAPVKPLSGEEASKAVIAARSKEPKTYRALQDGTDLTQGIIKEGEGFTTTQPQGSWMQPVEE